MMLNLQTLGIVSCLGGPARSCGIAADLLRAEMGLHPLQAVLKLQWHKLYPKQQGSADHQLASLYQSVSRYTSDWTEKGHQFLVVGGDHSCAMGTWSGVMQGMRHAEKFALIWLDAHMDAHTFTTSPSGNVHGMPLAALLGKADKRLASLYPSAKYILPENLILIGVRSFEKTEYDLLTRLGVQIIYADQISAKDGFSSALMAATNTLRQTCSHIGLSIDLDCIDPEDAPGVETPAKGGIQARQLLTGLRLVNGLGLPELCGLELCEYDPENDQDNKTLHLMPAIIEAVFASTSQMIAKRSA